LVKIKENFYDYLFNLEGGKWELWLGENKPLEVPPGVKFNQVSVPTKDSVRMIELMKTLIE
jgi:hypothetical protein